MIRLWCGHRGLSVLVIAVHPAESDRDDGKVLGDLGKGRIGESLFDG